MKTATDSSIKFEYERKDGEVVIVSQTCFDQYYQFEVYTDKDTALRALWNAYRCHYTVLYCSDQELMKLHEREVSLDHIGP